MLHLERGGSSPNLSSSNCCCCDKMFERMRCLAKGRGGLYVRTRGEKKWPFRSLQ